MYNDKQNLLKTIQLGEDSFLELKNIHIEGSKIKAPHRDSLADELAALANAKGGTCILGVADDTKAIVGIPQQQLDLATDFVRQICLDKITPSLTPIIEKVILPNHNNQEVVVLKVEIAKSLWVHKSPGGYMHRVGDEKREMSPEFLARLFQQRSQARIIRFDEQPVPNATLNDLTPDLWQRFATTRTRDNNANLLRKLGLATDEEGELKPTVAGILMSSDAPHTWLPNAFIQAVAYKGQEARVDNSLYQLDAADITGPIDQQILHACNFVKRNMRTGAYKNMGRRDVPQFDLPSVFEAIVNAVAHRDYSMQDSKIRLRLFSDRLQIYSPGAIPNTMTVDSLPYRQAARNETITSLLAKCPIEDDQSELTTRYTMMDKRGEGVSLILQRSEELSGIKPDYKVIDDCELLLTIYAPPELAESV